MAIYQGSLGVLAHRGFFLIMICVLPVSIVLLTSSFWIGPALLVDTLTARGWFEGEYRFFKQIGFVVVAAILLCGSLMVLVRWVSALWPEQAWLFKTALALFAAVMPVRYALQYVHEAVVSELGWTGQLYGLGMLGGLLLVAIVASATLLRFGLIPD